MDHEVVDGQSVDPFDPRISSGIIIKCGLTVRWSYQAAHKLGIVIPLGCNGTIVLKWSEMTTIEPLNFERPTSDIQIIS